VISFRADPASRSEVSLFLNRFQNTFQNMFQNRFQNTRLALSGGGRKRSGEESGCAHKITAVTLLPLHSLTLKMDYDQRTNRYMALGRQIF